MNKLSQSRNKREGYYMGKVDKGHQKYYTAKYVRDPYRGGVSTLSAEFTIAVRNASWSFE
jgi:hypothetical protein